MILFGDNMTWNPNIKLVSGEEHQYYLRTAYNFAWENSEDTVTKTGAVIVRPYLEQILSYGTNHFPKGVVATPEQLNDKNWKYEHIIHAEPAAIFSAARKGISTDGAVMYMPWVPCTPCAKSIIDAGIKTMIGHKEEIMKTPERWQESTNYALSLLEKCGVELLMYEGQIGEVQNLFNGEIWNP